MSGIFLLLGKRNVPGTFSGLVRMIDAILMGLEPTMEHDGRPSHPIARQLRQYQAGSPRGPVIKIGFATSEAFKFMAALECARQADHYYEEVQNNKHWHFAVYGPASFDRMIQLANHAKSLRNRRVWIDDIDRDWNDVLGFTICYESSKKAYNTTAHCFGVGSEAANFISCRLLKFGVWNQTEWGTYGHFINGKTFEFDIERIRFEIDKNLTRVSLCPLLRTRFIDAFVKYFPRKVVVKDNGDWKYIETRTPDLRAVPIEPRSTRFVNPWTHEAFTVDHSANKRYAIGVMPRNMSFLALQRNISSSPVCC